MVDERMKNGTITAALVVLLCLWYYVAADYGYQAVSGTYTYDRSSEHSTLILGRDQRFQQEIQKAGHIKRIDGSWRRIGEGGVVFSKDFMTVTGQRKSEHGEAYGEVRKGLGGLFISTIAFAPTDEGPVFHRKW